MLLLTVAGLAAPCAELLFGQLLSVGALLFSETAWGNP